MFDEQFWEERYRSHGAVWSGRPNPTLVAETTELTPGAALDDHRGRHRRKGPKQLPDGRLDLIHNRPRRPTRVPRRRVRRQRDARTVFREIFNTRAIIVIGNPSLRCSRGLRR
jgi:hypothetical protein